MQSGDRRSTSIAHVQTISGHSARLGAARPPRRLWVGPPPRGPRMRVPRQPNPSMRADDPVYAGTSMESTRLLDTSQSASLLFAAVQTTLSRRCLAPLFPAGRRVSRASDTEIMRWHTRAVHTTRKTCAVVKDMLGDVKSGRAKRAAKPRSGRAKLPVDLRTQWAKLRLRTGEAGFRG